jgi:hypothetical protein
MVVSNLAWLLPVLVAALANAYVAMAAALVMMFLSIAYHHTRQVMYEVIDTVAAVLFLISGPIILWQQAATLREWIFVGVVFSIAMAMYVVARTRKLKVDYIRWHSGWHVAGAVLCAVVYWCAFW